MEFRVRTALFSFSFCHNYFSFGQPTHKATATNTWNGYFIFAIFTHIYWHRERKQWKSLKHVIEYTCWEIKNQVKSMQKLLNNILKIPIAIKKNFLNIAMITIRPMHCPLNYELFGWDIGHRFSFQTTLFYSYGWAHNK